MGLPIKGSDVGILLGENCASRRNYLQNIHWISKLNIFFFAIINISENILQMNICSQQDSEH